jgi:hypothetical protein
MALGGKRMAAELPISQVLEPVTFKDIGQGLHLRRGQLDLVQRTLYHDVMQDR